MMSGLIHRVQNAFSGRKPSKDEAKQRLKAILIHDKVDLTRAQMEEMRAEILDVIGKYVEIDTQGVRFCLDRKDDHIALESTVPVRRMTRAEAS
jgi:cell division topological specificity factor